jgi:hydrogenase/urease accessory protein HupE
MMLRLALTMVGLLLAAPATAHTGGTTGFAKVSMHGQTVRYSLSLGPDVLSARFAGRTGAELDALAELVASRVAIAADGRACAPTPGTVTPPSGNRGTAIVVVHYACAAPPRTLAIRDDLFDVLGNDHHTLASFERPGGDVDQVIFEPDRRDVQVVLAEAGAASRGAWAFLLLGIEHILLGFDHILFVVALILRGGRFAQLLAIVTAFTVAHSVTLALSVLDIATLPSHIVEPVIALSIAYVALENILRRQPPAHRWAVGFLFGLVHGFGFAGALAELELPRQGLVTSLLCFNLGVELGQVLVIALLLPPLVWLRRFAWQSRVVTAASAVLLVAGLSLLVARVGG